MIVGVTGGIASGKSMVAEAFGALGATVVSADQLARDVVCPGSAALQQLKRRFGPGIINADGTLDRKGLGEIIFSDPHARKDLNAIMHPAIAELAEKRLRELAAQGRGLIVYEAPLLFEAGAEGRVDVVVVVKVDDRLQLQRLMARDGVSEEEARARIASQMSQEEKIARADYVIDNSGSLEEAKEQVRLLYNRLMESASVRYPDAPGNCR